MKHMEFKDCPNIPCLTTCLNVSRPQEMFRIDKYEKMPVQVKRASKKVSTTVSEKKYDLKQHSWLINQQLIYGSSINQTFILKDRVLFISSPKTCITKRPDDQDKTFDFCVSNLHKLHTPAFIKPSRLLMIFTMLFNPWIWPLLWSTFLVVVNGLSSRSELISFAQLVLP